MKKISKKNALVSYKVFNPDFTCRDFQFEVGKTYQHKGKVEACSSGFHSCIQANHCYEYYSFDTSNKVAECRVWGRADTHDSDSKIASEYIEIVRELSWQEVLVLVNTGKNNTGRGNDGDRNSGNWNSGNWNSGNWNSGDRNSGNWNSGNWNSGNWNSGDRNSGDRNSGDRNSGDRNSGDRNSGDRNSGDRNSGDRNSGNWNSGDRNSGDSNSGYRNSGAFCVENNPEIWLFDKPSGILVRDWEQSKAVSLMSDLLQTEIWVYASEMNETEKESHPHWETTDGYLKSVPLKESWQNLWNNLTDESKLVFLELPNFDYQKFEIITGLNVKEDFERLVK